jgi:hypothetical protein
MKKAAIIIVTLLLLITIPLVVYYAKQQQELRSKAAPATTLELSPASATKQVGDQFTVNVVASSGSNQVTGADIVLTYNPAVLSTSVDKLALGTFFSDSSSITESPKTVDQPNGKISYTVHTNDSLHAAPTNSTGTIVSITFTAVAAGTSTVQFDRDGTNVSALTESTTTHGALLDGGLTDATYTVQTAVSSPTPTSTTAPTPTTPPGATAAPTPTTPPGATATPTPTTGTGATSTPTPTRPPGATSTPTTRPSATSTPTPTKSSGTGGAALSLAITRPRSGEVITTNRPTISGTATAQSTITITIESTNPITGSAVANSAGNWSFTPDTALAEGTHTLTVVSRTPSGTTSTVTRTFNVSTGSIPVSGNEAPTLIIISLGLGILLLGFGMGLVR